MEIPDKINKKHGNLVFCMDVMYVNGMPMLTGIDKTIKFRGLTPLENRTADQLYDRLDGFLQLYNDADHCIKEIRCDREFKPLMDDVKDNMSMEMNYLPARDHEPMTE